MNAIPLVWIFIAFFGFSVFSIVALQLTLSDRMDVYSLSLYMLTKRVALFSFGGLVFALINLIAFEHIT